MGQAYQLWGHLQVRTSRRDRGRHTQPAATATLASGVESPRFGAYHDGPALPMQLCHIAELILIAHSWDYHGSMHF